MKNEKISSPLKFLATLNSAIKYSFYAIFFFVPLAMWNDTSELFELNKMWLVWTLSLLIFFFWGAKSIINRKLEIKKTPLDIPIALFLISQIISTIFSLDPHTSFWGYYSRFNGGLLSTISYIFLYYAFASNLISNSKDENEKPISYKILFVSLISGLIVTLWGIPSHFGYDPTCFVFRGSFDTSCWTESFKPTIRIFSTLGQPNWMATYMAILIPISMAFGIVNLKRELLTKTAKTASKTFFDMVKNPNLLIPSLYLSLLFLFYTALLWTRSQSGFLGAFIGIQVFMTLLFTLTRDLHHFSIRFLVHAKIVRFLIVINLIFFFIPFFIGTPNKTFDKYLTFNGLKNTFFNQKITQKPESKNEAQAPAEQLGGTDSSKIRLIVWEGALKIFLKHPIIGTGVETFAFAYYQQKPIEHNLTSEWNYLYNKAHNEFLNLLATTGVFGLGSYLLIISVFVYRALSDMFGKRKRGPYFPISMALLGSYVAILITNFFGFSVVITNLYFFLIPLFFFELERPDLLNTSYWESKNEYKNTNSSSISSGGIISIVFLSVAVLYFLSFLFWFWLADRQYALGHNLNSVQEYAKSYSPLLNAVQMRPNEDLYKNDLAINFSALSYLLYTQEQATQAAELATQAQALSNDIILRNPNNIVYLKGSARVGYLLSQINPNYIDMAIAALLKAQDLAPTDAEIQYNLALFYNQKGDLEKAIEFLNKAIALKPNYTAAYYVRALYYSELIKKDTTMSAEYRKRAIEDLNYILKQLDINNKPAQELLTSLQK